MGGVFQGGKSNIAQASMVASMMGIFAAQKFHGLGPVEQQQGTLESIELARQNIGNYEPEINESRRLTDLGATGITPEQIEKYTNPYLKDVLDWSIREMEEAADRRRQERKAITSKSGNDFVSSGAAPNRYQIEDDLADRSLFREIGGLTAQQRMNAYQQATGLATDERNRQANAGVTYGNYANQTSDLGTRDVGSLAAVGEMEAIPEINERTHLMNTINAYGKAVGTASGSVAEYQKPSILSQIVGGVGALHSIAAPAAAAFSGGFPSLGGAGGGGSSISGAGGAPMSYGTQVSNFTGAGTDYSMY